MRDGHGKQLSPEEAAKVKAVETGKDGTSLNIVSVDPGAAGKPQDRQHDDAGKKLKDEPAPGF